MYKVTAKWFNRLLIFCKHKASYFKVFDVISIQAELKPIFYLCML